MSKRYEETIVVEAPEGAIEAFWWRGRRYHVRQVLCRWREAGGWWEGAADAHQPWQAGDSREIWRLEAEPAGSAGLAGGAGSVAEPSGTYEVSHDLRRGAWTLFRVWD